MSNERMTHDELVALVRSYPIIGTRWRCNACGEPWCVSGREGESGRIRHAPDCARMRFERLYPVKETT